MDLYQQIFFTTLACAFGVLHFVVYLYNRSLKSNLYFTIFVFLYAGNIFFDFQTNLSTSHLDAAFFLRLHRAFMFTNSIFALRFIYSLFETKLPKQFWIFTLALSISGIFAVYDPLKYLVLLQITSLIIGIEIFRVLYVAIRNNSDGAWIITGGILMLSVFSLYDAILDFELATPLYGITNGYPFGFLGLILSMSIYLARDLSIKSEKIIDQEREAKKLELERRLLEAEDLRKTKELKDARQLQLSMLPECVNDIPGFDICFYMETAAEVGGDYYDYHLSEDKTLTIAIGDATGHGMKAGTMVSVIKSLFVADVASSDISDFMQKASRTIKQMKLGNLYMSLLIARFKDNKMLLSSAGMPPVYVYRGQTKSIAEIKIKAMPLGGPGDSNYPSEDVALSSGDLVLMMSDGYPELFNPQNETLEYMRVVEYFQQAVDRSADEIVNHLLAKGREWSAGRPQDDDITFIVVKIINHK
jgi:serine phosphatase RsbU (regulator of sigma subunit)